METLIEKLLGRPFMAPANEGSGDAGNGGASDAGAGGAADGNGDVGAGAPAKATAADIAARAGAAAFGRRPAQNGDAAGGDGRSGETAGDPAVARPDHIPEKFWNADKGEPRLDDLAKAYSTLQSAHDRLKQDKGVAKDVGDTPDAYLPKGIELPDGKALDRINDIPADDPALAVFRAVAHKHKIPVSVASGLAADFLLELNGKLPAPPTEADILKDLGDGGRHMVDETMVWVEGLYNHGRLSEKQVAALFNGLGSSADGIRALAILREEAGEKPIPMGQPVGDDTPSADEWYAMNRDDRYKTDEAFRNKVDKLGERIFGTDAAGSSLPGVGIPQARGFDRRERGRTHA